MKLNVIDLFAGCGGLTDGFMQTKKYESLAVVDWVFPALNTLKKRLSEKWGYNIDSDKYLHFDIQRIDELFNGYIDKQFGINPGLNKLIGNNKVDVVVGGPPCQAYSIAGRVRDKAGMQNDYRNYLFESYVSVVNEYKPQAFVFENVEGILSAKPGGIPIIDRITKAFDEIGYVITSDLRRNALFDTSYYNVPQKRKRVIIFGVGKTNFSNPQETIRSFYNLMLDKKEEIPLNSKSAFDNLPGLYPVRGKKHSHEVKNEPKVKTKNHEPRKHSERDIEIFKTLAQDIKSKNFKYISTKSLIELYKEKTGKDSNFHKYHVIREDKPSNTIPAHLYKDGLRHIHPDPEQARTITVREAARIQSFDDDYEFLGSKTDQYKMIGNAVPPKFAKLIAECVHQILSETNYSYSPKIGLFEENQIEYA